MIKPEALCSQVQPCRQLSVVPSWNTCTIEPCQRPKGSKNYTWKHVLLPGKHVMWWQLSSVLSWVNLKRWRFPVANGITRNQYRKTEKPSTAASCSTKNWSIYRWDGKKAICFTLLKRITKLKIVISESNRGSQFLRRKVFPEGLMSSCRIRHESRTCSELSYRIVMWNASRVQNTPVNPDQSRGNLEIGSWPFPFEFQ